MRQRRIVLVAAECKGVAKVGGLGDVVADLAQALHAMGASVSILMPCYESAGHPFDFLTKLAVPFGQGVVEATVMVGKLGPVPIYAIASDRFFSGAYGGVYIDSGSLGRGPFEDDAQRFAFFCLAAATALDSISPLKDADVVHCHDWHTGTLALCARLTSEFPVLSAKPLLFTIHNLDYQGVRPLEDPHGSGLTSLQSWIPGLYPLLSQSPHFHKLKDPIHSHCYNSMRAAILLADRVSTVSPNYAREITRPDNPSAAFVGGRGLDHDLLGLERADRLTGLLNGISYQEHAPENLHPPFGPDVPGWQKAKARHRRELLSDLRADASTDFISAPHAPLIPENTTDLPLAVFVGRLAGQKVNRLFQETSAGMSALEEIADKPLNVVLLGTGERQDEMASLVERGGRSNCLFIRRFDADLATRLYAAGDLFLMPSDFEPCGISQLIAMRYGTLPVATSVGGLADTIVPGETGFLSSGENRVEAADAYVAAVESALATHREHHRKWMAMQVNAMKARFTWEHSANEYMKLYDRLDN